MSIKRALDNILEGNLDEMRQNFSSALTTKAVEKLEERKIEIAKNYFGQFNEEQVDEELSTGAGLKSGDVENAKAAFKKKGPSGAPMSAPKAMGRPGFNNLERKAYSSNMTADGNKVEISGVEDKGKGIKSNMTLTTPKGRIGTIKNY